MKVLALFSLFVAAATSEPVVKTWTLRELSVAIETSAADPSMMPYLKEALNRIMLAMYTGMNTDQVEGLLPSPTGAATWTVDELKKALKDPETDPEYIPLLSQTYQFVMERNKTGNMQDSIEVSIPALDISTWSQSDLSEALKSPSTKPDLIPYLEKARHAFDKMFENGERPETVGIVTPIGLVPSKAGYRFLPKTSKASNHIIDDDQED